MTDLNELLGAEAVEAMTRSWLAYSATNIVFTPDRKLLLGVRAGPPKAIPEPGELALVGGFNTGVPGPAMFKDVADFHARDQLGLELTAEQCSAFTLCEFPMEEISKPLKTSFGAIPIKRVVFMRTVRLSEEQMEALQPQGKLRDVLPVDYNEFPALVATGKLTFPFQVQHVLEEFTKVIYE